MPRTNVGVFFLHHTVAQPALKGPFIRSLFWQIELDVGCNPSSLYPAWQRGTIRFPDPVEPPWYLYISIPVHQYTSMSACALRVRIACVRAFAKMHDGYGTDLYMQRIIHLNENAIRAVCIK